MLRVARASSGDRSLQSCIRNDIAHLHRVHSRLTSFRGSAPECRAETCRSGLEGLVKTKSDIVTEDYSSEQSISASVLRFGHRQCRGDDGAARMKLTV